MACCISSCMARERSPPLLKCRAIWFRLDPIFPYCARSDLTSSMSITIWYFGVSFLFKIRFRMKSDLVILHFSARFSKTDNSISVSLRHMMCVRLFSLFLLMVFILLLPMRDRWSHQQRRHSLKYRLSLPDRFQCCAQHSVGSQYNSDTFLISVWIIKCTEITEGMGNRNPHQEPDHGECKSQKICFCITGWILLFENSYPLTNRNEKA